MDGLQTWWAQHNHKVWNGLDHQIGWFLDDAQLARGQLYLFPGEQPGSAADWKVMSADGLHPVSAAEYLVNKGLQPAWLSLPQSQALLADTSGGLLPTISLPQLSLPGLPATIAGVGTPMALAIGGGGLLLILLLTRRRA